MKTVLVIGGAGFVGGYLIEALRKEENTSIIATKLPTEQILSPADVILDLDILDTNSLTAVLEQFKPSEIYHLAAQSSVALSWSKPSLTLDINIKGTTNLLESVRLSGLNPSVLLIGSGEEYGYIKAQDLPVDEETIVRPGNIYAASKACQTNLGCIYATAYGMNVKMVRAFNHIGPRQNEGFVVSGFCRQVALIEAGLQDPVILVGNLDAKRDFTDVRDIVQAYILLSHAGQSGEIYNVGSGRAISIKEILNEILSLSSVPIDITVDPKRLRPSDVPIIEADIKKVVEQTGWRLEHDLRETLEATLNYWRIYIKEEKETNDVH